MGRLVVPEAYATKMAVWMADHNCIGIDPGDSTGVVKYVKGTIFASTCSYGEMYSNCSQDDWLMGFELVAIENFLLYPHKAEKIGMNECWPARIIGAVEVAATRWNRNHQNKIYIEYRNAQEAKESVPNELIDQLFGPGFARNALRSLHERDAMRHLLLMVMKKVNALK